MRLDPTVERSLNLTANRWKWLRFLQHSATVAAGVALLVFLLHAARVLGWLTSPTAVAAYVTLILLGGFFAWMVTGVVVAASQQERRWLAAAMERAHAPLLDRLNTLVFLEQHKPGAVTRSYFSRIEKQAQAVLHTEPPPFPFSPVRPLGHVAAFGALLLGTIYFCNRFPLRPPAVPVAQQPVAAAPDDQPLELPPPEPEVSEQQKAWGEVRITRPGHDLTVTRVDSVPIQIEAAASQPLKSVEWFTAVNGAEEQRHVLPPPAEPRYAAYQPLVNVPELGLADWDVLTYYARATTDRGDSYRSEIYFMEVQPFREELENLPGGETGNCYGFLSELTGMIERQQEIIRQTYRAQEFSDDQTEQQKQAIAKLAGAEAELAEAAKHLAARMASELDRRAIREPLEHLSQAESHLEQAADALDKSATAESQRQERGALAELSAARKQFQKCLATNPDAFAPEKDREARPRPELAGLLERISEFRDEAKAAQEFVATTLDEQRQIAQRAQSAQPPELPPLADQEDKLRRALDEFQKQHPQMFRDLAKECSGAQSAMGRASEEMRNGSPEARTAPGQAAEQLEALTKALKDRAGQQQLADAYKLKKMLDQKISQLAQLQEQPDSMTAEQIEKLADDAKQITSQLKQVAENEPTSEEFGSELREALDDQNKQDLDAKCDSLCQAQGSDARREAAADAKSGLAKVADAFNAAQPEALAKLQKADALRASGEQAIERGLQQLESLMRDQQGSKRLSPADAAKQRGEALENLQTGVWGLYGYNERSRELVRSIERDLKDPAGPVDAELIRRLVEQLQSRRVEVSQTSDKKPDDDPATFIDPARLSPAYRKQIEKYFEKLSEQR